MVTERQVRVASGWNPMGMFQFEPVIYHAGMALVATIVGLLAIAALFIAGVIVVNEHQEVAGAVMIIAAVLMFVGWLINLGGFFTLEPNEAAALVLFGAYKGTARESGFWWTNPFFRRMKVSLRARNMNGQTLKVNDKKGNPIEIAAVVVWRVQNTVQALFDVDHYTDYVNVQAESAVRHLASSYPYDDSEGGELSLRASQDEVAQALQKELNERVSRAGVVIDEARISHLAYAPEIAGAMLRRQQAEAILAARQKIVDGAVGMVEMALARMDREKVIDLDPERRAAMVSNLMVVLCSDRDAQPVVNAGTLYQ